MGLLFEMSLASRMISISGCTQNKPWIHHSPSYHLSSTSSTPIIYTINTTHYIMKTINIIHHQQHINPITNINKIFPAMFPWFGSLTLLLAPPYTSSIYATTSLFNKHDRVRWRVDKERGKYLYKKKWRITLNNHRSSTATFRPTECRRIKALWQ